MIWIPHIPWDFYLSKIELMLKMTSEIDLTDLL